MSSALINDIKTYLAILFNKPVNDYNFNEVGVYRKFYKSFAVMFDYQVTDIIIIINKFKKTTSKNILTIDMMNKFEMFGIIPIVDSETTRININNFQPLH